MIRTLSLILLFSVAGLAAQPANLGGTWVLSLERSHWGAKAKPIRSDVTILHAEPKYSYQGTVLRNSEDSKGDAFSFDGAIDGRPYPIKDSTSGRTLTLTRKSSNVLKGEIRGADGKIQETIYQSISGNGRTLVRKILATDPNGKKVSWTEIYEKKS